MKLFNKKTNNAVSIGDFVQSFRDESWLVTGWREPQHAGSTGKIYVKDPLNDRIHREFNVSVFGLEFREE